MFRPSTLPLPSPSTSFLSTLSPPPSPSSLSSSSSSSPRQSPTITCAAAATCHAPPYVGERRSSSRFSSGSLYEILRVKNTATSTEIKAAYRNMAKVYHPDASESDGRDFIEIHNAYATLSDPAARALYDLSLGFEERKREVSRRRFNRSMSGSYTYSTRRWETDQCW